MAGFVIVASLLALVASYSSAVVSGSSPMKMKAIEHITVFTPLSAAAKEYLDAHNKARAAVGVAPLIWSQSLANLTSGIARYQRTRMQCDFASLSPGTYGANQLWTVNKVMTPRLAVEAWVEGKQFYDYATNTCLENKKCGVYKQVVWRNSTELGCAMVTCSEDRTTLTICFYYPLGNIIGEKPY